MKNEMKKYVAWYSYDTILGQHDNELTGIHGKFESKYKHKILSKIEKLLDNTDTACTIVFQVQNRG